MEGGLENKRERALRTLRLLYKTLFDVAKANRGTTLDYLKEEVTLLLSEIDSYVIFLEILDSDISDKKIEELNERTKMALKKLKPADPKNLQ